MNYDDYSDSYVDHKDELLFGSYGKHNNTDVQNKFQNKYLGFIDIGIMH